MLCSVPEDDAVSERENELGLLISQSWALQAPTTSVVAWTTMGETMKSANSASMKTLSISYQLTYEPQHHRRKVEYYVAMMCISAMQMIEERIRARGGSLSVRRAPVA